MWINTDISNVERGYRGHFFSEGARRFFNSRIFSDAILLSDGSYLFVTSERFEREPRYYTVRHLLTSEGMEGSYRTRIVSVGSFQEHTTSKRAWAAAKAFADKFESENTYAPAT